jgi:TolA-binding protein
MFDAGPYTVIVTGTEFDLNWRLDEQTLDLRLHKGSVTVEGPLANGGIKMKAGERLIASAGDGKLSLMDDLSTKSSADEPSSPSASIETRPPSSPTTAPEPIASIAARDRAGGWQARIGHGEFQEILDDAERRGLDKSLASAPATELAALADAARYARRQDIAQSALRAERTRFPKSVQARDASFFLGGLAEVQKDDAASIDWYDVYLRESPNGAYAPQALGRKMLLVQKTRGTDAARPIATEYLERFATGPYVVTARKLLQLQ